jgi:hypothetical protein
MFHFRSQHEPNSEPTVDKHALVFGLISVFLCGIGFSIIAPVVPFLVRPYTSSPAEQATMVTLLTSVYAVCVFFAAPVLGALSDRYGRRPLLLVCLLGSAIGHLIFGIGGALWVLVAGRIYNGRGNRREHQHDLRLFCGYHSTGAENQVLWLGERSGRGRLRHWPHARRIASQVRQFSTPVFWSDHHAAQCGIWIFLYAREP